MITDPGIESYAAAHSTAESEHLADVAEATRRIMGRRSGMMVGSLEGGFLATLVALSGAESILEIGTFTGYSALSMAPALPAGGRIVTCEVSAEHAALARDHIASSAFADRIEVRLGPALETIAELDGPFDMVFIDADKDSYDGYFEAVLPKLSESGFIVIDNVLWGGRVLDGSDADDADTLALKALNDKLAADPRVTVVMLPIRDGVTIARPRT